jgi:hypothetical protein
MADVANRSPIQTRADRATMPTAPTAPMLRPITKATVFTITRPGRNVVGSCLLQRVNTPAEWRGEVRVRGDGRDGARLPRRTSPAGDAGRPGAHRARHVRVAARAYLPDNPGELYALERHANEQARAQASALRERRLTASGRRADAASRARIVDADGAWWARASALRRAAPSAARLWWDRRRTPPVVARIAAAAERSDAGLAVARGEAFRGARLDRAARGAVRVRPAAGHGTRAAAG